MYPPGSFAEDFYGPSPDVTGYGADPPPANTASAGASLAGINVNASAPIMALVVVILVTAVLYHIPAKS